MLRMRRIKVLLAMLGCAVAYSVAASPAAYAQHAPGTYDLELSWGLDGNLIEPGQVTPFAWQAGACWANFADIREVNGFLEWGVESHCTGTGWYPHQLSVTLEQRRALIYFDEWTTRFSPSNTFDSTQISLLYHNDACEYGTSTTYRMTALLTAGPRSKWGISDEAALPCKLYQ